MHTIHCINDVLAEEINLFMNENVLKYENSLVASTSDFYWYRARKNYFGSCIGNVIANRYMLNNGIYLFV